MKRTFVPENFNVDNVEEVKALYQSLLNEEIPNSPEALRAWILKWSELGSVLSEVSCRRYVAMTVNTQDEAAAKAEEAEAEAAAEEAPAVEEAPVEEAPAAEEAPAEAEAPAAE